MSDLRKHLETARQEYQSLQYPGNLAGEILTDFRRRRIGMLLRIGAMAAVAAVLVIMIRIKMSPEAPSTVQVAIGNPQTNEESYSDPEPTSEDESEIEVASFGELPAMSLPNGVSNGLDLAPSAPDFSFSTPSFTALISDEQSPQTTSTTRESV